jgi:hypothetical protein
MAQTTIYDLPFTIYGLFDSPFVRFFVGRREIRDGRSEAVIEPAFTGG